MAVTAAAETATIAAAAFTEIIDAVTAAATGPDGREWREY